MRPKPYIIPRVGSWFCLVFRSKGQVPYLGRSLFFFSPSLSYSASWLTRATFTRPCLQTPTQPSRQVRQSPLNLSSTIGKIEWGSKWDHITILATCGDCRNGNWFSRPLDGHSFCKRRDGSLDPVKGIGIQPNVALYPFLFEKKAISPCVRPKL